MDLSIVTLSPLLAAAIILFLPQGKVTRYFSLVFSIIQFVYSITLLNKIDTTSTALQLTEKVSWIKNFGVNYHLGVDGISLWLVLLTTFLLPLVILGSWTAIENRTKLFHFSLFLLQTSMIGTFLSIDAVLFYLFWELSLVPMYLLIGIWGGQRRVYATIKFFIFTMVGSIFMLAAIIYLMLQTQAVFGQMSASLLDFYKLDVPFIAGNFFSMQTLLFFAFAIAFCIKVPVFPFHTWLPDAHVEAPTPGSVILAGVMLKMGGYGLIRWAIPMFPEAANYYSWLFVSVSVIGIIYGACMALVQTDIKKLVAYSSVSHMGYVILGIFAFNIKGVTGGIYQMLNHGISTSALFFLVGMVYEKTHTREIKNYGGITDQMPIYTILFIIITLSSIAAPLTNGFVGEFLILMGSYEAFSAYTYFAVSGVVLGAAYMLWMVKRVFFGEKSNFIKEHPLTDINIREFFVIVPFVIMVFWMGIRPGDFLKFSESSISYFVKNYNQYNLTEKNVGENK